MSDCLRMEIAPRGVGVGVAYFLFLDTDMVRDAERELPGAERSRKRVPGPFAKTYPLAPRWMRWWRRSPSAGGASPTPGGFSELLPLRQMFASEVVERGAAKEVPEAEREYEQAVAERGAAAAGASERTRRVAGLWGGGGGRGRGEVARGRGGGGSRVLVGGASSAGRVHPPRFVRGARVDRVSAAARVHPPRLGRGARVQNAQKRPDRAATCCVLGSIAHVLLIR